jgi:transcriptional regulator with XRE-family HTH domain
MSLIRLKYERLHRGWSQGKLAERARLRQQDLSLIEMGRLNPTSDELERLALALSLPPASASILLKPAVIRDEESR